MAMPVPISAAVASGRARAKKEGRPRGAARAGGREAKPMAAGWTERLCGAVTYVTAFPPGRPPEDGARRRATGVALAMPRAARGGTWYDGRQPSARGLLAVSRVRVAARLPLAAGP